MDSHCRSFGHGSGLPEMRPAAVTVLFRRHTRPGGTLWASGRVLDDREELLEEGPRPSSETEE